MSQSRVAEALVAAALALGAVATAGLWQGRDEPVQALLLTSYLATSPVLPGVYGPDRLGAIEILEAVDGRRVATKGDLRAALAAAEPGSVLLRWRRLDGAQRDARVPWPPADSDRLRALARAGVFVAAGFALTLLSLWFRRNAEPVENRSVSFLAAWLAGLCAFAFVDYHGGGHLALGGISLFTVTNFALAPPIVHVGLLLLGDGRVARARPGWVAAPYAAALAVLVPAAIADQWGRAEALAQLRLANALAVGAASIFAGVALALSDARAKRRMQLAHRDLEERNRRLREANESLEAMAHSLRIAMAELERHQQRATAGLTEEAAMGRMVSNLAHTFQRPLVPLYNFLDKLESEIADFGELQDRYGKFIPEMVHRIDDLIRVCRFVLAMPRTDAPQDLSEVAREAAALVRRDAERQGRDVRVEVLAGALPPLRAARSDLFFTIHELANNAARAVPAGGRVWIRLRDEPEGPRPGVVVEVSDDGPGIDAERIERIFEPYNSTSTGESRGLGLYLVERAVERLGGEVRVTSSPGTGTLFVIRLPSDPRDALGGGTTR